MKRKLSTDIIFFLIIQVYIFSYFSKSHCLFKKKDIPPEMHISIKQIDK